MLGDGYSGMEAGLSVLPGNTIAIHRLEVIASLAAHRVERASAARHFVLTERLNVYFWVHRFGSLNRLLDRRLALQDEHFALPNLSSCANILSRSSIILNFLN